MIVEYIKDESGMLKPKSVYNILISTQHSPDVDNEVLVKKADTYIRLGDFSDVKIISTDHYDLYGELVESV